MSKRIIIALDFDSAELAQKLLDQLDPHQCRVKIGKELFTACGPLFVKQVVNQGFDVFLDLKFHDIPTTVAKAVKTAANLGVWMINVHASGGKAMMQHAREVLEPLGRQRPLLIGVTVLTSMERQDLLEIGINASAEAQVEKLAVLTQQAGLDGVVCSAAETSMLRSRLGNAFVLVTPGIRREEDAAGDQKRFAGPADAIRNGSDFLVVGRPITRAASPAEALSAFNLALAGL